MGVENKNKTKGDISGPFEFKGANGMTFQKVIDAVNDPKLSKIVDLTAPQNVALRSNLENTFARAALAVNRSGVAQLGFNPSRTMMDMVTSSETTVSGLSRDGDSYVNHQSDAEGARGTIVHESIHNGVKRVFKEFPALKDELQQASPGSLAEEHIVRYIMYKTMGNPEPREGATAGNKQIEEAKYWAEESSRSSQIKAVYKRIEAAAQEIIGRKQGGPR